MAKDPSERHRSATELVTDLSRAFTRRTRAAFAPPGPIEVPEETGIRKAEGSVPTRETPKPSEPSPATTKPATAADVPVLATKPATAAEVPAPATKPATAANVATPEVERESESAPAAVSQPQLDVEDADAPATALAEAAVAAEAAPAPPDEAVLPEEDDRAALPAPDTEAASENGVTADSMPAAPVPSGTTAPAAEKERPAARARPRGPPRGIAAAVLLLALLAAGYAAGKALSGGDDEPAVPRSVSAKGFALEAPAAWTASTRTAQVPGLPLEDSVHLTDADGAKAGSLSAGFTTASGPTLLPAALLDRVGHAPEGTAVKLGSVEALRYEGLRPEGFDRRLTLYTVPTTGGVLTIACSAPAAPVNDFMPRCEEAALSLDLKNVDAFPLGPDEDYLRDVQNALTRLDGSRRGGVRRLRQAKTPAAQARRARAVAQSYSTAAGSLSGATKNPLVIDANRAVVHALQEGAAAYRALAGAAGREERGAYDRARKRIARADASLRRALKLAQETAR